jgi:hypothetical protein
MRRSLEKGRVPLPIEKFIQTAVLKGSIEIAKQLNRPVPKTGKGWLCINMAESDVKELRILARANGSEFRAVCRTALSTAIFELRERLGLPKYGTARLTENQVAALAERSRLLSAVRLTSFPGRN